MGKGAFLNNHPIYVNNNSILSNAMIASAYSAHEAEIITGLQTIEKLAMQARKVIINFSPAMDLCNIARGRLDGIITKGTTPEDHAAGSLILTEAGGMVQNFDNNLWNVNEHGIIASNGLLQNVIRKVVT